MVLIIFKVGWEKFHSAIESHINLVFLNYTVVSFMWPNQKILLIVRYSVKDKVSESPTGLFPQSLLKRTFLLKLFRKFGHWSGSSRRKAWLLLDLICKAVFNINRNLVVIFFFSVNFLAGFQRQLQILWGMYIQIMKPLYLKGFFPIVERSC